MSRRRTLSKVSKPKKPTTYDCPSFLQSGPDDERVVLIYVPNRTPSNVQSTTTTVNVVDCVMIRESGGSSTTSKSFINSDQ